MKKIFALIAIGFLTSCAELQQVLLETASTTNPALSNLDIANGLKQALKKGVDEEVTKLTQADGFLGNAAVKIMLPQELTTMDERLRSMGLGYLPDKGMELLNRAAEDAVKEATPIFVSAIQNMSFADARNILMGHDSSATNYLRSSTTDSLYAKFYPVVETSLSKVGADEAWNSVTSTYNKIPFITKVNPDLKDYVTLKALDGVFKMITVEEKDIRNDLGARSSDLLKRVFALQDKKQGGQE